MHHGAVVVTVLLAALAAGGGWVSGRELAGPDVVGPSPAATLTAPPSVPPSESPSASPPASPTPAPQELLEAAKRATVRLAPPSQAYHGSGTVVSPEGLVITNAHVAAPQAPGLAFQYGDPATLPDPEYLVVSLSPPGDRPAVPTYRASLLVADGYLDLAVLQIDAMLDGSPLPPGQRFDSIATASVDDLATGDGITVLGYPGVAGGRSLSVTTGEIATFLPDESGRVQDDRYEIDTSGRIAGGNSGGAAIDQAGRLIGVPSAKRIRRGDYSGRIRPVDLAAPLLEAARSDSPGDYVTPYDVLGTGEEEGEPLGWGGSETDCEDLTDDEYPAGAQELNGAARLSGMTEGEDLLYVLAPRGREDPLVRLLGTWSGSDGCVSATFRSSDAGYPDGFPPGEYEMRVNAGPQLRLLTTVPLVLS